MLKKPPSPVLNEENCSKSNKDLPRIRACLNVWFTGLCILCLQLEFTCVPEALEIPGEYLQPPFTTWDVWFFFPSLGGLWALLSATPAVQAGCPPLCRCEREDRDRSGGFSALFQRRNLSGWEGTVKLLVVFCSKTSLWMSSLRSVYE